MRAFSTIFAVSLLAVLAACNTVRGLGEDVETGGQTLTETADDAADEI